jgi:hypothetical protein
MSGRIGLLTCLPVVALAGVAYAGNDRLDGLFNQQPTGAVANLCYVRHYDKPHLASHRNQNVTDMLVYLGKKKGDEAGQFYYVFDAQVKFRDSKKQFTFDGDCNRDAARPGVAVNCGIDCDGGGFSAVARENASMELTIGEGSVRLGDPDDDAPLGSKAFQSDDKTFVLHQTELKDCLPVIYDDNVKAQVSKGILTQ